jgi:hypothetical protein
MDSTPHKTRAPYHPRFKRTAEGSRRPLRLRVETENDRHVRLLWWIYQCPYMTPDELLPLFPPDPRRIKEGGTPSGKYLEELMKRMWQKGFLSRRALRDGRIAYGLGNKGADVLSEHGYLDRGKVDWTQKIRRPTEGHVEHARLTSRFRRSLILALETRPDMALEFWQTDGEFQDEVIVHEDGKEVRIPVRPDAFFRVSSGAYVLNIFWEGDRSNESHSYFVQKLKGYWNFFLQKLHTKYDMQAFAVLTGTKSHQRAENLREAAREVTNDRRGLSMLWFSCEREYVDNPCRIFEAIWRTPLDEQPRSLLGQRRVAPSVPGTPERAVL